MRRWMEQHANLWTFLLLFCICYCIETISSSCLYSSLQSIERQFQIPSTLSGLIASISDVGYILAVVLISYMGGRGNRARWIGAGCLLISLACMMIASTHFIFPYKQPSLNLTPIKEKVRHTYSIRPDEVGTPSKLLHHPVIGPRLSHWTKGILMNMMSLGANESEKFYRHANLFDSNGSTVQYLESQNGEHLVSQELSKQQMHYSDEHLKNISKIETAQLDDHAVDDSFQMTTNVKRDAWNISDQLRNVMANVSFGNTDFQNIAETISDEVNGILRESVSPEKLNRLMQSARRPFTYCDQAVVAVKTLLQTEKCKRVNTNKIALGIIFVSMVLIGIGHCMPWSLGIPLIDDKVKKRNTPLFFAMVCFLRVLGPVLGYFLGAGINRFYVTLSDQPGITMTDHRWIGAWWLGFLLTGGCLFLPSLLLFFFPSSFEQEIRRESTVPLGKITKEGEPLIGQIESPVASNPRQEKRSSLASISSVVQPRIVRSEIKKFFLSLVAIMKCPVYVCTNIARLLDAFAAKGLLAFQIKVVQEHYALPQHYAIILLGTSGPLIFGSSVVCGGVVMRRFKLYGRRAVTYMMACTLLSGIMMLSKTLAPCTSTISSIGHKGKETGFNFTNPCNAACNCNGAELFPVCDKAGNAYYSPCHAGCRSVASEKSPFNFTQCDCVAEGSEVSYKWCKDDCRRPTIIFFIFNTLTAILAGNTIMPETLLMVRSVPDDLRSVALGLNAFLVSLISTLPAPVIYGLLLDKACLIWNKSCNITGACAIYDTVKTRTWFFGLCGTLRLLSACIAMLTWIYAKDVKIFEEKKSKAVDG